MIQELHISNLAVIEDTTLEFPSVYVSLIGETGAGKSLIVSSLGLIKGEKADFSLMRDPKKKSVITAVFSLSDDYLNTHPEAKEYLEDSNQLILKRTLNPDHTSKTYINDEPVSLTAFRSVSSHLIDIHSQGANWELFDGKKHLFYLDRFASSSIEKERNEYQDSYRKLQDLKRQLDELESKKKETDPEYLSFQIKEIEKAHLKENEIEDLNEEYLSLRESEKLQESFNRFKESVLLPEGTIQQILFQIKSRLSPFEETSLKDSSNKLVSSILSFEDAYDEFENDFHKLHLDPNRIEEINQRLFELKGLQRKFGKTTSEILEKLSVFKSQLEMTEEFDIRKEDLLSDINNAEEIAKSKASLISQKRKKCALKLEKQISDEMDQLGLQKNGFKVHFTESELNKDGMDKVEFQVRMNQGMDFAPLEKAASGGEASRLMLSLKVVLNALDPYDLLVFDEIDTGVSGRIASLIAKKIRKVSNCSQVLVISHLAQVVSSSLNAIKISKKTMNGETITTASVLDEEGFQMEVARILSGETITEAALKQAKQLIEESRS